VSLSAREVSFLVRSLSSTGTGAPAEPPAVKEAMALRGGYILHLTYLRSRQSALFTGIDGLATSCWTI